MKTGAFRFLDCPDPASLPVCPEDFLAQLGGPTLIRVKGRDASRCRVVSTLMHGNEPSGFRAVHRLLRTGLTPATDVLFFIISVATALEPPLFSHRQLPGERDMNRCFAYPWEGRQGALARSLLECIDSAAPEAVLDVHNTSGEGPPFGVCIEEVPAYGALVSLFSHRLVITDLRLGALMEHSTRSRPIVTIECGGARSRSADRVAWRGLVDFVSVEDLYHRADEHGLDCYRHPVRLELTAGATIAYSDDDGVDADVVLPPAVENRNFGLLLPGVPLARVNDPGALMLKTGDGQDADFESYFIVRDHCLYAASPLKLFMVTTNAVIAQSDCLLYAVRESFHDHLSGPDGLDSKTRA